MVSKEKTRFAHVNIVAEDWRTIAAFYVQVFGCEPVPPERSLKGAWLEEATGVHGAQIRGIHLRLPGLGDGGPTLEIFEYVPLEVRPAVVANRPGLAHLAFEVDRVAAALGRVIDAGGRVLGQQVSREIAGVGRITFAYATDPEGNIIELQRWERESGQGPVKRDKGRGAGASRRLPMRDTTLCLLTQGNPPDSVLLGYKKEGFGTGKYTGFGGKVEAEETVYGAAARELEEETGLRVALEKLRRVGDLTFVFPAKTDWSQRVHVFQAGSWQGELAESREMIPAWFAVDSLPFDQMWHDARTWLPRILNGQRVRARFRFAQDNETVSAVVIEPWEVTGNDEGQREGW